MKKTRRSAFTLVELVIVIAVIAILAAVMIPTFGGIIQSANEAADKSTAANLTIAISQEINGIKTEKDLYDVIEKTFGEDYASKIAPKTANKGNHFWYDVNSGRVVFDSFDKLAQYVTDSTAHTDSGVSTIGSFTGAAKNDFATNSPRALAVTSGGKTGYFYFIDKTGSDVANIFTEIDNVKDGTSYLKLMQKLGSPEYSNDGDNLFATKIMEKLLSTAIVNQFGMFAGSTTIANLYIPEAGENAYVLGNDTYVFDSANNSVDSSATRNTIDVSAIKKIDLPNNVVVGINSLVAFNEDNTSPLKKDATTIYANIESDALSTVFKAYSTNCVIEIANGERYVVVGEEFKKLNVDGTTESAGSAGYTYPLESFVVSINNVGNKAYLDFNTANETNILYVADDITQNITFTADNFLDTQNNTVNPTVVWTGADNGVYNVSNLTDGANIEVSAQAKTYKIQVKVVSVTAIDLETIGGFAGALPDDFASGTDFERNFTINYKLGESWNFTPVISTTPNGFGVTPDTIISVAITNDGGYLSYTDNTDGSKKLSLTSIADGDFTATLTLTYSKNGVVVYTKVCNLKFEQASTIFETTDNTKTKTKYGFDFVIGTKGSTSGDIQLGTLFKLIKNASLDANNDIVVEWMNNGEVGLELARFAKGTDAWTNWTEQRINIPDPANGDSYAIAIRNGGQRAILNVNVVKDAYNVGSEDDWKAMPNSTAIIAVLNNFSISDKLTAEDTKDLTTTPSGVGYYSKNLGSTYIHGNLCTITFGDFTIVKQSTPNYFLSISSGTIENLLIEGPKYNQAVKYADDGKTGMYLHGIYKTGTGTLKISGSYISGFRAPIRLDSGTLELPNTTLKGGAIANLYNYASAKMVFDNTTMIAYYEESCLGAGVFVDSGPSDNPTVSEVVINSGGLHQYTWGNESEARNLPGVSSLGILIDTGVSTLKKNVGTHKLANKGTTEYLHVGFVIDPSATVKTGTSTWTNGNAPITGYIFTELAVGSYGIGGCGLRGETSTTSKQHTGSGLSHTLGTCSCPKVTTWTNNCSHCDGSSGTHIYFPDSNSDGKYDYNDFLATYNN